MDGLTDIHPSIHPTIHQTDRQTDLYRICQSYPKTPENTNRLTFGRSKGEREPCRTCYSVVAGLPLLVTDEVDELIGGSRGPKGWRRYDDVDDWLVPANDDRGTTRQKHTDRGCTNTFNWKYLYLGAIQDNLYIAIKQDCWQRYNVIKQIDFDWQPWYIFIFFKVAKSPIR